MIEIYAGEDNLRFELDPISRAELGTTSKSEGAKLEVYEVRKSQGKSVMCKDLCAATSMVDKRENLRDKLHRTYRSALDVVKFESVDFSELLDICCRPIATNSGTVTGATAAKVQTINDR